MIRNFYKSRMFAPSLTVAIVIFAFIFAIVRAATTISTNITTAGTLTVSGLTSLGNASTTILSTTGNLLVNGWATTTGSNGNFATEGTLYVTSSTTLAGLANVGGALAVKGATTLGSTLAVTGVPTFSASSTFNAGIKASSTLMVTGATTFYGNMGVASSTPSAEISATGSGTTTLFLHSSTAAKGGCIELKGPGTNYFRLYATTSGVAVWESGTCAGITSD